MKYMSMCLRTQLKLSMKKRKEEGNENVSLGKVPQLWAIEDPTADMLAFSS